MTLRDVGHLLDDRDAGLFTAARGAGATGTRATGTRRGTGLPTTVAEGGWARVDAGRRADLAAYRPGDDRAGARRRRRPGRALPARPQRGLGRRPAACGGSPAWPGSSSRASRPRPPSCARSREEVGVAVRRIAYVGSQAWPFPGSLMLGFTAYADPEQPVRVDPTEIAEARWFTRREVAAGLAGERVDLGDGDALRLPMSASIAAYLISRWLAATRTDPAVPGRSRPDRRPAYVPAGRRRRWCVESTPWKCSRSLGRARDRPSSDGSAVELAGLGRRDELLPRCLGEEQHRAAAVLAVADGDPGVEPVPPPRSWWRSCGCWCARRASRSALVRSVRSWSYSCS